MTPTVDKWLAQAETIVGDPAALRQLAADAKASPELMPEDREAVIGRCSEYLSSLYEGAGLEVPENPTDDSEPLPPRA